MRCSSVCTRQSPDRQNELQIDDIQRDAPVFRLSGCSGIQGPIVFVIGDRVSVLVRVGSCVIGADSAVRQGLVLYRKETDSIEFLLFDLVELTLEFNELFRVVFDVS